MKQVVLAGPWQRLHYIKPKKQKYSCLRPHPQSTHLCCPSRLETALSEIAWSFYLGEIKGVRAHRDFLNKTNHSLLFVRHQFKLGFLNEMRNDRQTAIKSVLMTLAFVIPLLFQCDVREEM